MDADREVIQVIPVVNHPSGVFGFDLQGFEILECGQAPEWAVQERINRVSIVQVEGIDRIARDLIGVGLDNALRIWREVIDPQFRDENARVFRVGRAVPERIEFLVRKMIRIAAFVTAVQKNLLERLQPKLRHAHCSERNVIVFDVIR